MGNWIAVRLRQPGPNRDAIGAWVEVRTGDRIEQREVTIGGGHAGGQLGWIHFAGEADGAATRVVARRKRDRARARQRFATIERDTFSSGPTRKPGPRDHEHGTACRGPSPESACPTRPSSRRRSSRPLSGFGAGDEEGYDVLVVYDRDKREMSY
jgi:hypothetical protein